MKTGAILLKLSLFIALSAKTTADRQHDVVMYVDRLAQDLQKQLRVGVFNCWIVHFADDSTFSTMHDELVYYLSANYMSLMQVKQRGKYTSLSQDPSLAIIILSNSAIDSNDNNLLYWLAHIPYEATTIVLFEHNTTTMEPLSIGNHLNLMTLWNVILIPTNIDAVYTFHYVPMRVIHFTGYPDPAVLFYDRLSTLQTRYILTGFKKDLYTMTPCETVPGEDLALFQLFADTINMRLFVQQFACDENESLVACSAKYTHVDFFMNRFTSWNYSKYNVNHLTMQQVAIATPKGRLLTIWEILLQPFQESVWWSILAICIAFELMEIVFPTLFSNSLISLALFGFEKYQLRFTKPPEKVTASALIMMFFLLKCAYEAKLITYITETPRNPGASSIQELHDRNITVYHKHFDTMHLNKLDGLLENYVGDSIAFEGLTIVDNRIALSIEMLFNEVDGYYSSLYQLLDENVFEMVPFYAFQPKSQIRQPFIEYHQRVFEVGLPLHWHSEMLRCYRYHVNLVKLRAHRMQAKHLIQEDKFKPLVLFFGLQWVVEVGVFIAEVIAGRLLKCRR
uniref:Ionotropic receptor n=1 Tax=Anopheles stephensi TaxID=30069 RepID=A0A182YM71_ANOST